MDKVNVCWFRRDLRLYDNAALYHALKGDNPVLPVFIFDRNILDDLEDKSDRRVEFIHAALEDMQAQLKKMGSSLEVYYGFPKNVFKQLLNKYTIEHVFTNHDFEQYAIDRDDEIAELLKQHNVIFHTCKDHVIFEKDEVVKDDNTPFTVFSAYCRRWKTKLNDFYLKSYPAEEYFQNFYKQSSKRIPSLDCMNFKAAGKPFPPKYINEQLLKNYHETRNFPGIPGTSRLSVHLRFGTVSIRELARIAKDENEIYLNELVWRDFYQSILWHFPHVREGESFKQEYDQVKWRNDEKDFEKWCAGKTGYPIVDAGMRELNETGFMHNRVRMITASFLTKHLLIHWSWGEAYFAKKLLDYDYASNNGGWQWAAGSGCDAAPFFRIFNPTLQAEKFDKKGEYIKKWVPELDTFDYPQPIVEHEAARKRALKVFGEAVKSIRV